MKSFGKNINIKRRKKDEFSEKDLFIDVMTTLDECWIRTNYVTNKIKINTTEYEEPFYLIAENLVFLHYGEKLGMIILWWVFERFDEKGKLLPLEFIEDEETSTKLYLETSEDLWDFINKLLNNGN
jgi:hypothetical protein